MTLAPSLVEQRVALQGQLRAQRQEVAERLFEAKIGGSFPRSATVRLLMRQPALVGSLVALFAGPRVAGSLYALLTVVQGLKTGPDGP